MLAHLLIVGHVVVVLKHLQEDVVLHLTAQQIGFQHLLVDGIMEAVVVARLMDITVLVEALFQDGIVLMLLEAPKLVLEQSSLVNLELVVEQEMHVIGDR